jgi:Mg/Co/Ni transporter MgtE
MDEIATLRMRTLRMLLRRSTVPLVVIEESATLEDVRRVVRERRAPLVVVVDAEHALLGTVSPAQLAGDDGAPTRVAALRAEEDVDATAARVLAEDLAYVLVIESTGELIGILSAAAITDRPARRAA